jgi:hypothetical protein
MSFMMAIAAAKTLKNAIFECTEAIFLAFCGIGTVAAICAIVVSALDVARPASASWIEPSRQFSRLSCVENDPSDLFHECPQPSDTNLIVEFQRGRDLYKKQLIDVDIGIFVDNTSSYYSLTTNSSKQPVQNCHKNNGLFVAQEIPTAVGSTVRFTSTTKFVNALNPTPCACLAFCGDREHSSPYGPNFPRAESARDCNGNPAQ